MAEALERADGIAYRQAGPADGPAALLVHGFPESSYMWRHLLPALADAGWRAVAPDLPGSGDSPPDPPGTWERQMEALERFRTGLGLEQVALVVHDWGGLIGLRWACEHPDAVSALVVSNTGFFADGEWHDLAAAMRTEGTGEELMSGMTREALGQTLRQSSESMDDATIDEYWKGFADEKRRHGHLELYRSGDFEKLAAYEGRLAQLGVPALILWGENDPFAPVAGAYRFQKELPDSQLVLLDDAGHFVYQDAPDRTAEEVVTFLRRAAPPA
jgi:haloalkane dehalogenase